MSTEHKDSHWKGQSRVLKVCHWCGKKQPTTKRFQACSRCKQVIYCSKECQVASWPHHKALCKLSAETKALTDTNPAISQAIGNFKKWHGSHLDILCHTVICALDLGNTPTNADVKTVFIEVQLKFNHAELPASQKYEPIGGFTMTMDETREVLLKKHGGKAILDSAVASHEHMKRKGGLGVATLLMMAHDIIDVVKLILPSRALAKSMQMADDWGDDWADKLRLTLELR